MHEKEVFTILYSSKSLEQAKEIIKYLRRSFTEKEVNNFYLALADFEKVIAIFPELYPESGNKKIRRAVLSKQLSVYYATEKTNIIVVAIIDNRWSDSLVQI